MSSTVNFGGPALETLDKVRATSTAQTTVSVGIQPLNQVRANSNNGLQSIDSIQSTSYNPNPSIPASGGLAPLDAISPQMPGPRSKEDTKERGVGGFAVGVVKGIGKAAIDTVGGVVTLGKVVVGGITHPKKTLEWIGGGVKYAVNHPIKAAKAVVWDLPTGIVKGIVKPYSEAVKEGKYGEAIGRGVFDIGLILLTAGLGSEANGAKAGGSAAAEVVTDGAQVIDDIADGAKIIDDIADGARVIDDIADGAKVVTQGVQGGIQIGEHAIKLGNVGEGAKVVINIGNTTAKVSTTGGRVARTAAAAGETMAGVEKVAKGAKGAAAAAAAVETVSEGAKVSGAISNLFKTMGEGAKRIGSVLKPMGNGLGSNLDKGLVAIVGTDAANVIKGGVSAVGNGLAKGGAVIKEGAVFVKAHPVASAAIAGRATDIIQDGLTASDYYRPGDRAF